MIYTDENLLINIDPRMIEKYSLKTLEVINDKDSLRNITFNIRNENGDEVADYSLFEALKLMIGNVQLTNVNVAKYLNHYVYNLVEEEDKEEITMPSVSLGALLNPIFSSLMDFLSEGRELLDLSASRDSLAPYIISCSIYTKTGHYNRNVVIATATSFPENFTVFKFNDSENQRDAKLLPPGPRYYDRV